MLYLQHCMIEYTRAKLTVSNDIVSYQYPK